MNGQWYAILELAADRYIQVGLGKDAGAPGGEYSLEYRDGGPDRHWRTLTWHVADVERAFLDFLRGDMSWTKRHSWTRPSLSE